MACGTYISHGDLSSLVGSKQIACFQQKKDEWDYLLLSRCDVECCYSEQLIPF